MNRLLLLFALALCVDAAAQKPETPLARIWRQSLPFITNYTTDHYKAAFQNWSLVQGDNGLVYAANNSGVLEYDGVSWRLIETTEGNPVRSLAKDANGRIYVGGSGEVGYLSVNGKNQTVFYSLKEKLPQTDRNFGNVWFTFSGNGSVYFVCDLHILELANGQFRVWKSDIGPLGFAWFVNDTLYVSASEKGLLRKEGHRLRVVPGGERFKGMGLTGLLPYEGNKLLAVGLNKEFFVYDGASLEPFMKDGQRVRIRDAVYHGLRLSNGTYALATTGSGLYFMEADGTITNNICRKEGLSSDALYAVFEDAEKDLWLATDNGISRVEIHSPLRILNENHGLDENPMDMEVFNNKLFVTNSKGIFELNSQPSLGIMEPYFNKIEGIDNLTLHCQAYGDALLVSNYDGVFSIDKSGRKSLLARENVVRVEEMRAPEMPRHLLVGLEGNGLSELLFTNGKWTPGARRDDLKLYAENVVRTADGTVLVNTRRNGIYEMAWETAGPHLLRDAFRLVHHGPENGLGSNQIRSLERVGNVIYASTNAGVHRFNPQKRLFEADSLLTTEVARYKGGWVNEMVAGQDGQMWFTLYHNYQSHVFGYGKKGLQRLPVSGRLSEALISKVSDHGDGFLLFGSNKWIALLNQNHQTNPSRSFQTLIRRVSMDQDSLVTFTNGQPAPELAFGHRLRFQFALPSFDLSAKNQYQYYLEGFHDQWSAWSGEPFVDFTNLPEGSYVFRVRGKDVYGHTGKEGRLALTILPPWYRTWWAFALIALLLTGLAIAFVRFRERKLQTEKLILENTVRERTEKIMLQTEALQEMDRMKSRFFANISHEFRTPLTLILAPLEEELSRKPPAEQDRLLIMKRYANRLLELVNQLLNLSKLEAGKMELQVQQGDLRRFLSVLSSSFDSLAQHREIHFVNSIDLPGEKFWFDADKLEKVIANLLSNAFKFTPAGGTVSFSAGLDDEAALGATMLRMTVADTGRGIALAEQKQVFESFYQARQTVENQDGGTGLGLAYAKELIKLHRGSIALQSEPVKGSVFTVLLPVTENAFDQAQRVVSPPAEDSASGKQGSSASRESLMPAGTGDSSREAASPQGDPPLGKKDLSASRESLMPADNGDPAREATSPPVVDPPLGKEEFPASRESLMPAANSNSSRETASPPAVDPPPGKEEFSASQDAFMPAGTDDPAREAASPPAGDPPPGKEESSASRDPLMPAPAPAKEAGASKQETPASRSDFLVPAAGGNDSESRRQLAAPSETILIVEDNAELRNYMASLLEKHYIIYTAPDGAEALACARKVLPSLIVSDLMMPKMDGMELTARIKSDERTSHIPVILLTAKSGQESRIDGLKTGADDYLTKPFSVEELTVRVANLITLRRKLAERYRERIRVHVTAAEEMSLDDKFLLKARQIVEANMEDVLFSVEKMAEEMSLSRTQLLRKLKALTGLAPNDFIRDLRLQKAAEMIRQRADTITQIGYAVGFNDQSYFSKSFKKEFGETPTEYSARFSQKEG